MRDIAAIIRTALGSKAASQPCRCFRKSETGDDYVARIGQQQECRQRGGACEDAVQRVVTALADAGVS